MYLWGEHWLEGVYLGRKSNLSSFLKPFVSDVAPHGLTTSIQQLTWIQVVLVNAGYDATADPNVVLNNQTLSPLTFKAKSIYVNAPGLSDTGITAMAHAIHSYNPHNNNNNNNNVSAYFIYDLYSSQSTINKVARDATAFCHRNSLYSIQMVAYWYVNTTNTATRETSFIDDFWSVVRMYATAEAYQNYIDRDMPLCAYYGGNFDALVATKNTWDPHNVFNFPQTIPLKV